MFKRTVCWILALLCLSALPAEGVVIAEDKPQREEVLIGYIGTLSEEIKERSVFTTFEFLKDALRDKYDLRLISLSVANLDEDLRTLKPQFVLAPTEIYLELSTSKKYGAHDIASLKSIYAKNSGAGNGSVFIAKADRHDLNDLEDIRGKSVVAQDSQSLIGWWSALGEIERQGYDSEKFFGNKNFVRTRPINVVEEVLSGASDIGILPTCYLETLEGEGLLSKDALKVVSLYTPGPEEPPFYCRRSTKALYPGLIMSSLANTPDAIVKDFLKALFSMPVTEESEWAISNDFIEAIDLMRSLRFGMYANLSDYSLSALVKRYQNYIYLAALILLFLAMNEFRVHRLVDIRTKELSDALRAKEKAEEEAMEGRKRLSHIERSGVISQMSNIIAHELKQPLGALINYAAILKLRLKDQFKDDNLTKTIVENMDSETRRISQIVDSVRRFAKKEQTKQIPCNLLTIVQKAIRTFNQQEDSKTEVPFKTETAEAPVLADPLSLELLILNLVRNAASASKAAENPQLGVQLSASGKTWKLLIWNNGNELSNTDFAKLEHAAESTKAEGLGLGLAIVREIADMHAANLHFSRLPKGGVSATLTIDRFNPKDKT